MCVVYGSNLYASDPTLTILIGPTPCVIQSQAAVGSGTGAGSNAQSGVVCLTGDASASVDAVTGLRLQPGAVSVTAYRRSASGAALGSDTVWRVTSAVFAYTTAVTSCPLGAEMTANGCVCIAPLWAPAPETPLRCM